MLYLRYRIYGIGITIKKCDFYWQFVYDVAELKLNDSLKSTRDNLPNRNMHEDNCNPILQS